LCSLEFRDARSDDLAAILSLLSDDSSHARRIAEPNPADPQFAEALKEIDADPNNRLIVAVQDDRVIGTFHLTVISGVSLKARRRLQIEAVRVRSDLRGQGIGEEMMRWAEQFGRDRGCTLIQLTTDRSRDGRAKTFYERLGFTASHHGMKRRLD